jgi:hypothetical protein
VEFGDMPALVILYIRGNKDFDGGWTDGQASDLEALLALRQALTGLDKLKGWSDLETHRDVRKCDGITVDKESGRVTGLVLDGNDELSGGHVQCKGHDSCLLQH